MATDTQPFVQQTPTTPSGKWQRFYAMRNEEVPLSSATASVTVPVESPTRDGGYEGGAASELVNHAELPILVRRLYDVLQLRHEPEEFPPQYGV
ncbi:hypothetical protein PENSPDRAFT_656581 [Peniophora sp. CONT]|nr:hypothetical protein PENSPDRAFT_656581 [Peniophora sp. CONT]